MTERPRVAVIFTGGTIAMLPDPETGAAMPALQGGQIVARVPGLTEIADIEAIDWGLVPASHLSFAQILEISELIRAVGARDDIDGVVIVQGTDVLEETAFAWDLLHRVGPPVAVVGAMRHAGQADYDGPRNLRDAIQVAAHPALQDQGVVVVMAGQILPADDVTKTNSQTIDTFQALNEGALGHVEQDRVVLTRTRSRRRVLAVTPLQAATPVILLTAVVATDGELLRAALASGAVGFVIEATGAGNTDADLLAAAQEAMAAGVPVALTTRCASGSVGPDYGFPGGGATWAEAGAIMAGTLSGPKARVALALGLGAGLGQAELVALIS